MLTILVFLDFQEQNSFMTRFPCLSLNYSDICGTSVVVKNYSVNLFEQFLCIYSRDQFRHMTFDKRPYLSFFDLLSINLPPFILNYGYFSHPLWYLLPCTPLIMKFSFLFQIILTQPSASCRARMPRAASTSVWPSSMKSCATSSRAMNYGTR